MRFKKYRNIQFPNYCEDLESMRAFVLTQQKYIKINLKKKRNKIKFEKNKWKYVKDWVKDWVKLAIIARKISNPIIRMINYEGISSKIVTVEECIDGVLYTFDNFNGEKNK